MESSIRETFDPDDPVARFLLSMSIARNDIESSMRSLLQRDDPAFGYRIRVLTGHFVEASLALKQYRQHEPKISRFLNRLPQTAKKDLSTVVGTSQRIGAGALEQVRSHTFHYPHPDPKHPADSDAELADTVRQLSNAPAKVTVDWDEREVRLTYADQVAHVLAFGAHSSDLEKLKVQWTQARDGAFALRRFVDQALLSYGISFGGPE